MKVEELFRTGAKEAAENSAAHKTQDLAGRINLSESSDAPLPEPISKSVISAKASIPLSQTSSTIISSNNTKRFSCQRAARCWGSVRVILTDVSLIGYPFDAIINNLHPTSTSIATAIQADEGVKNRLQLFGREGEHYDEILIRLVASLEELDVEEIIESRWSKLQKEKKDHIPLEE